MKRSWRRRYLLVSRPDHPFCNSRGRIAEHRLILEAAVGRYINPRVDDAHHKNGDVHDNRLENLEVLTKLEHRRFHAGWVLIAGQWWKTCRTCGRFLRVEPNFYRRRNSHNEYMSECKPCAVAKSTIGKRRLREAARVSS